MSVQDNGIGIAKDKIDKIFSKFGRIDGNQNDGSGIGLYLVKKMLSNAEGEIEVESKLGQGSCFEAYFKA